MPQQQAARPSSRRPPSLVPAPAPLPRAPPQQQEPAPAAPPPPFLAALSPPRRPRRHQQPPELPEQPSPSLPRVSRAPAAMSPFPARGRRSPRRSALLPVSARVLWAESYYHARIRTVRASAVA